MFNPIVRGLIFGVALAWAGVKFPAMEFWVLMLIYATACEYKRKST